MPPRPGAGRLGPRGGERGPPRHQLKVTEGDMGVGPERTTGLTAPGLPGRRGQKAAWGPPPAGAPQARPPSCHSLLLASSPFPPSPQSSRGRPGKEEAVRLGNVWSLLLIKKDRSPLPPFVSAGEETASLKGPRNCQGSETRTSLVPIASHQEPDATRK